MNSRRLWNLQQRHKFFEGFGIQGHFENQSVGNGISRAFQEVLFTVDAMLFRLITHKTQDWEQCHQNVCPGIPRHCTVRTFHRSKPKYVFRVIQNWETDASQYIKFLFGGAYFVSAVKVEEDESSRLKIANQPAVLAGYRPLLTALRHTSHEKQMTTRDANP